VRIVFLVALVSITVFAAERTELVDFQVTKTLLQGSKYSPVLAVVVNNSLYYSDQRNQGRCRGRNLYRADLNSGAKDIPVRIKECVTALRADENFLYMASDDGGGHSTVVQVGTADSPTAKHAEEAFLQLIAAIRFHWDVVAQKENLSMLDRRASWSVAHDGSISYVKYFPGAAPKIAVAHLLQELTVFSVALNLPPNLSRLQQLHLSELGASNGKIFAGFTDPNDDGDLFSALAVIDLKTQRLIDLVGSATASADSDFGDAGIFSEKWSNRKLRYLAPTQYGFVVADRTDYDQEVKRIAYYSPEEKKLYRLNVPSQDVGGLFFYKGGLVISQPINGSVIWTGSNNI
jgi:hypothetical protein